jgi:hypothetical protein
VRGDTRCEKYGTPSKQLRNFHNQQVSFQKTKLDLPCKLPPFSNFHLDECKLLGTLEPLTYAYASSSASFCLRRGEQRRAIGHGSEGTMGPPLRHGQDGRDRGDGEQDARCRRLHLDISGRMRSFVECVCAGWASKGMHAPCPVLGCVFTRRIRVCLCKNADMKKVKTRRTCQRSWRYGRSVTLLCFTVCQGDAQPGWFRDAECPPHGLLPPLVQTSLHENPPDYRL